MYTQRSSWFPRPDAIEGLRAALETRQRFLHGQGLRAALQQDMGFGAHAPVFHVLLTFESLADWLHYRTAWPEAAARLRSDTAPLIRQPVQNSLNENLTPLLTQPGAPPVNFILRQAYTPAPGNGQRVRALMLDWAEQQSKRGYRYSVALQIVGSDAQCLIQNTAFERIEEFEGLRSHIPSDTVQEYLAALSPLLAGLPRSELLQTLVAAPPTA